jgi:TetR/AcrR family transcriptional regulator, fatty acid biosynthesis regulator
MRLPRLHPIRYATATDRQAGRTPGRGTDNFSRSVRHRELFDVSDADPRPDHATGSRAGHRRRLDPRVRRDLILDQAARIVLEEGLSAVSMEGVGRAAGVSKALVYNYFPTKTLLLSELLVREYRSFRAKARAAADQAHDFESLIRTTTRAYLDHVATRGALIQRLLGEPLAAEAVRSVEGEGRQATVNFFGRAVEREFGLSAARADTVSDLLMGLTSAAGDHLIRVGGDLDEVENMVVEMILAALRQIADRTREGGD